MSCCRAVMSLHLQMYLVLGVVSLYQSNFEPIAQFDHRQLLPTPTAGGAAKGGSNNRSGSDRKKSGDRTEASRNCATIRASQPRKGIQRLRNLVVPNAVWKYGQCRGQEEGEGRGPS